MNKEGDMTIRESTVKEAQTARVSRWKTLIIVAFGVVLRGREGAEARAGDCLPL